MKKPTIEQRLNSVRRKGIEAVDELTLQVVREHELRMKAERRINSLKGVVTRQKKQIAQLKRKVNV